MSKIYTNFNNRKNITKSADKIKISKPLKKRNQKQIYNINRSYDIANNYNNNIYIINNICNNNESKNLCYIKYLDNKINNKLNTITNSKNNRKKNIYYKTPIKDMKKCFYKNSTNNYSTISTLSLNKSELNNNYNYNILTNNFNAINNLAIKRNKKKEVNNYKIFKYKKLSSYIIKNSDIIKHKNSTKSYDNFVFKNKNKIM